MVLVADAIVLCQASGWHAVGLVALRCSVVLCCLVAVIVWWSWYDVIRGMMVAQGSDTTWVLRGLARRYSSSEDR